MIVWVACAILSAVIVEDGYRGRAAALGFILGPLGALIAGLKWSKG